MTPSVILKAGREKSLRRRHPWIFSGAIARVVGEPEPGQTVDIRTQDGTLYGRGAFSGQSQIMVRVWTFDPEEEVSSAFFEGRLNRAIRCRASLAADRNLTALRLVNAESDGLPGIVVDRYEDFLVCQFLSTGAEFWKQEIVALLAKLLPTKGIYERSDVDVRAKEGLLPAAGVLSGDAPPDLVEIKENPCRFLVDIRHGHKTGFYLDQRDSRARVADFSKGAEVLNCFAYTGGFGIRALAAGAAHVTNIEASASALSLARRHVELNGLDPTKIDHVEGDVFEVLRQYRDAGRSFDLVILDPPKFAESRRFLERASRGYKDINWLAFRLLRPGGILFTFSCSGLLDPELFRKIVADAALDARCDAQVIGRLGQPADHPFALHFPEGSYLKGLICKKQEF